RARRGVDGAGRDARRRSGEARRHRPPVPRRDQLRHVHRLRSARRRVPRGGGTAGHDRSGGLAVTAATRAATMAAGARRRGERTGVQRERHQPAYPLLVAVIGLVAAGVVMVYSASSVRAYFANDDPATYGMQQLIWAGVGLGAMFVASRMDFRWLRYLAIPAYLGTMALLVAVLIPGIGTEVAGSRRWILLPAIGFQPAELAKLAMVLYLAHWLDRRGKAAHTFWNGLVPFALLAAPGFVLIAAAPDL